MAIFLWQDKASKLQLLGSIHFLPPTAHPLPEQIGEAYKSSSRIVFEARFDKERNLDLGWLPGGRSLSDVLKKDLALATESAAEELGVDFENMKRLRPWAFVNDLIPHQLKCVHATHELGVERYLLDRAKSDGKPVEGLEDIDYFARRFNASPIDVQIDAIRQFLRDRESGAERYTAMVDAWVRGDVGSMEEIVKDQWGPFPRLAALLLHQRNRNWLPRLVDLRKSSSSVLVVVGCGHMVGEGNLLELLGQKGAVLEQL